MKPSNVAMPGVTYPVTPLSAGLQTTTTGVAQFCCSCENDDSCSEAISNYSWYLQLLHYYTFLKSSHIRRNLQKG